MYVSIRDQRTKRNSCNSQKKYPDLDIWICCDIKTKYAEISNGLSSTKIVDIFDGAPEVEQFFSNCQYFHSPPMSWKGKKNHRRRRSSRRRRRRRRLNRDPFRKCRYWIHQLFRVLLFSPWSRQKIVIFQSVYTCGHRAKSGSRRWKDREWNSEYFV